MYGLMSTPQTKSSVDVNNDSFKYKTDHLKNTVFENNIKIMKEKKVTSLV